MKNIRIFIVFILCFTLFVITGISQEEKAPIIVPDKVEKVIQNYIEKEEPRTDIPFEIVKAVNLPAQNYNYVAYIFKMKNKDLGFQSVKQENGEEKMVAELNLFMVNKNKKGEVPEKYGKFYVPMKFSIGKDSYKPEESNYFTVWNFLPEGEYDSVMAITSKDLKKIGISDIKLSLSNPAQIDKLTTTPIFFVNRIDELEIPEQKRKIHKDYFVYARKLLVEPKIKNEFEKGKRADIFFTILGFKTKPENPKAFDLWVSYELLKEDKTIMKTKAQQVKSPLVSQPIPLVKKGKEPVEPGKYTIKVQINDNIGGQKIKKLIDITVIE